MNFTELYNKIKTLDEAGPAMMDPAAMMQQQMANMMQNNPAMQKLDPNVMMQQQQQRMQQMKQQSKQAQAATLPGQDSYTVNGKAVSKAEYDAFMAQHPDLAANMQNPMNVVKGMKPPSLPNMPKSTAPTKDDDWEESIETTEEPVDECGDMMMGSMPPPAPKQQDNVTMNVSMNGSGAGGIKDLMAILKNIESGRPAGAPTPSHDHDALFGDSYENSKEGSSDSVTLDVADITQIGNDMHGQGGEAPKVNGGGNPMQEALVKRLESMYNKIKSGE